MLAAPRTATCRGPGQLISSRHFGRLRSFQRSNVVWVSDPPRVMVDAHKKMRSSDHRLSSARTTTAHYGVRPDGIGHFAVP